MKRLQNVSSLLTLAVVWVCFLAANVAGTPIMVEKNLFALDRKPPSPESAVQSPQPNKTGLSAKAIQLDGVFIRGETKKAIVRVKGQIPGADKAKTQNPYVTVTEGEKLGDFQVVKIEPRRISLEKDGQTEVVNLFAEGKIVVPAPPQPTSPAPLPVPPQPGQAPPGQMGGPPPQPPQQGQMGGNVPGVGQPPNVANLPPGGRRPVAQPGHNQPDMNAASEDEGDLEEEAAEEPSS